jgi:hypothetical protein
MRFEYIQITYHLPFFEEPGILYWLKIFELLGTIGGEIETGRIVKSASSGVSDGNFLPPKGKKCLGKFTSP